MTTNEITTKRTFDSSTTLSICEEGFEVTKEKCFLQKTCTFQVWHILLFLTMILTITAVVAGVSAKYAPGSGTAAMFVLKLHLKSFFFFFENSCNNDKLTKCHIRDNTLFFLLVRISIQSENIVVET